MAVAETNGNGQAVAPSGVYRHPDTGEELIAQATGKFGNPQADAITRLGFVYVGPAKLQARDQDGKAGEVFAAPDPGAGPIANTSPSTKSSAELEVDLAAAKAREASALKAQDAKSNLLDPEAVKAAEEAKAEADKEAEKGAK